MFFYLNNEEVRVDDEGERQEVAGNRVKNDVAAVAQGLVEVVSSTGGHVALRYIPLSIKIAAKNIQRLVYDLISQIIFKKTKFTGPIRIMAQESTQARITRRRGLEAERR